MIRRSAGLVVAVVLSSCTCDPTGYEGRTYACQSDVDCTAGFRCLEAVCALSDGGTGGGSLGGGVGGGGGSVGGGGGGVAGGGLGGGLGGGGGGSTVCADLPEICGDDLDQNCNDILDDGCECDAGRPCYPDQFGLFVPSGTAPQLQYPWDGGVGCSPGVQVCMSGQLSQTCTDLHVPVTEFCDGKDNDCDGVIDLGCPCQNGRDCYPGAPFTNGVGVCQPGTFDCAQPASQTCTGVNLGGVETCNGLDDDCNGLTDDNLPGTAPCAPGVCSSQFRPCVGGVEAACNLASIPGYSATEVCGDQQDNNCNGAVDEGCTCTSGAVQDCYTGPATSCDGGGCYGVCRRGTQTCGASSDGGLSFGTCANEVVPGTESCSNGQDDDCDQFVDCADLSQCTGRSCGSDGKTCLNSSCQCIFDGGVSTQELCNDAKDNTCDALIDCAQSSCAGQSCGTNGKRCVGTTCTCVVDGGTSQSSETTCNDGRDNDCDGLVDCAETSSCAGAACATGKTCRSNVCTCLTDGGVPQGSETLCADGVDNDCDGLVDCADPNCSASCENCKDGVDNDGDTLSDCLDPDCQHKTCSLTAAGAVCCGTSCVNVATDPTNCGQCGLICPSGACTTVVESAHTTGRCTCVSGVTGCPTQPATPQSCNSGLCDCGDDDDSCGANVCGDRACYYP